LIAAGPGTGKMMFAFQDSRRVHSLVCPEAIISFGCITDGPMFGGPTNEIVTSLTSIGDGSLFVIFSTSKICPFRRSTDDFAARLA